MIGTTFIVLGFSCAGSEQEQPKNPATAKDAKTAPTEITCKGKPEIGKPASPFKMAAMGGGKTGLEKGKVTLVDFWATWCEPCKKSFPKYQELYVKYKASGLEIVAVSVDDEDTKKEIASFVKTHGDVKFPVAWDDGHKVAECYKPPGMPSAFIIDKQGVVKFMHQKYTPAEEKEIEKEIKGLL